MRQESSRRRRSRLQSLFAERHVYMRSGDDSRFVVLSRPLLIGVTLGLVLVVGWLAFASYSSVANHLEVREQSREMARLEGVNKSLRAAAETAAANENIRAAANQVPELRRELEEARAARERAERLAEASAAEAEELRRELGLVQERIRRVTDSLGEAQAERDALARELESLRGDAPVADRPGDGSPELRAELEAAAERVETLSAERNALEQRVEELSAETEASEAPQLAEELAEARAEIERLQGAARTADAGADGEPSDNELQGTLQEAKQLREELDAANQRIAELQQEVETTRAESGALEAQIEDDTETPEVDEAVAPQLVARVAAADGAEVAADVPVYNVGEATIEALSEDLAAAKDALDALKGGDDGAVAVENAAARVQSAGQRVDALDRVLEQIKAREAAMSLAMSNLAPPPPPANPR